MYTYGVTYITHILDIQTKLKNIQICIIIDNFMKFLRERLSKDYKIIYRIKSIAKYDK